jgi:hypothetical protein
MRFLLVSPLVEVVTLVWSKHLLCLNLLLHEHIVKNGCFH